MPWCIDLKRVEYPRYAVLRIYALTNRGRTYHGRFWAIGHFENPIGGALGGHLEPYLIH